jgi:hypothetical protein
MSLIRQLTDTCELRLAIDPNSLRLKEQRHNRSATEKLPQDGDLVSVTGPRKLPCQRSAS